MINPHRIAGVMDVEFPDETTSMIGFETTVGGATTLRFTDQEFFDTLLKNVEDNRDMVLYIGFRNRRKL